MMVEARSAVEEDQSGTGAEAPNGKPHPSGENRLRFGKATQVIEGSGIHRSVSLDKAVEFTSLPAREALQEPKSLAPPWVPRYDGDLLIMDKKTKALFVFPKWVDGLRPVLGLVFLVLGPAYTVFLVWYGLSPQTVAVGYQPEQPVPYSHALHAGELGMDCRYCHNTVETAAYAAIPPTRTCMNCHGKIRAESPKLLPVRESYSSGLPVPWIKVHDLPDYVYFDHSAHVARGVGCVECHGRVDKMEEVYQVEPLSMGWCLDCHRNPEPHLRPPEYVTAMDWAPQDGESRETLGRRLREQHDIDPSTDCSTCHR
jgi:hypothetical protein